MFSGSGLDLVQIQMIRQIMYYNVVRIVSRSGTRTSPVVLPDPEHMGLVVGISLLSRCYYVDLYALPAHGGHL